VKLSQQSTSLVLEPYRNPTQPYRYAKSIMRLSTHIHKFQMGVGQGVGIWVGGYANG
jgi:hypothetical protein